jgi:hypothetical protein
MDETGNPTTRGYEQPGPINVEFKLEPVDGLDLTHIDRPIEIEFTSTDEDGNSKPITLQGGMVEADGLTWWERKIRELEADGRGKPLDEAG